ncbi:N-acetylmuramoyl-L-alanine amidase [Chryseobacterium sp. G0201]|uniref:N-acetylmuramoyl-L-alanine amidase n=1 Tax=Chryseobacterium sp. G0201 TaxID=2487065 RepID=UPI000F4DCCAA|nr:N-acetylmuramoyl-L-alanine amidase [Chryseobacterium sp. G0201]AZA53422.1 hypothetical protein EG348_10575 [Chryseobacterium sp. G0201]
MSKKGISKIKGPSEIRLGETAYYEVSRIYDLDDKKKVDAARWKLYALDFKHHGNWRELTPKAGTPPKIGYRVPVIVTNQSLVGSELMLEAYIYEPEKRIPPGLRIKVLPGIEKKITRVDLFKVDDTPIKDDTVMKYGQTIKVKVYTQNMQNEMMKLSLYEDDAQGGGDSPKNKNNRVAYIKKLLNKKGFLVHEFKLNIDFAKIANAVMDGSHDKLHEYYVVVETAEHKSVSKNVDVQNPDYVKVQTVSSGVDTEKIYEGIVIEEVVIIGKYKKQPGTNPPVNTGEKVATVAKPDEKKKENKECECFCNKEITPETLREMVIAMRKATYDDAGENFYKWNKDLLFTGGHEKFNDKSYAKFAEVLKSTFEKYEITSCIRKIHFLAQCYHETGAFMRSVEGGKDDKFWYDPYRGRGFIHLTLKGNYQKFKEDSKFDVVNNPELVSTNIEIAAKSSGWYWRYNDKGNINPFADKDSVFDTSRLVNKPNATKSSSINGYNQRVNAVNALKVVFKYPQNCCSLNEKETPNENNLCPSGSDDCICTTAFKFEDGFINHSKVIKDHISIIEHGLFKDPKTSIQKIVLHRTAGGTTQACKNAFKNGRKNKSGGIDHYGTHFIVGKDGVITQTANLTKVTWHCAGWNSKSVGIEVVGFAIDKDGKPTLGLKGQNPVAGWENLTEKQAKSVACLVKALLNYYSLDISKIDCHEHLAPKEKGEGQIVFDAIKEYLK